MKTLSPTTTAGTIAAAALIAAESPGVPPTIRTILHVTGAIALGLLGRYAQDCPVACPGTDQYGRRIPYSARGKTRPPSLAPLFACLAVTALVGCIAANPLHKPGDPTQPAYIVAPSLTTASNAIVPIVTTAGQASGTGSIAGTAAAGVFGLLAAISTLWARHKSQVADTLARGLVSAGPLATQAALDYASNGTKFAAVAELVNNNTPSPTPAPPLPPK